LRHGVQVTREYLNDMLDQKTEGEYCLPIGAVSAQDDEKEVEIMENNTLQIFRFESKTVRVIIIDGVVWWVLKDVCDVLDIGNSRDVAARLDDDEKGVGIIDTPGGKQEVTIINEPGLFKLILRSNKPEAKIFQRFVTHEVLPAIRKTGKYAPALEAPAKSVEPSVVDDYRERRMKVMETNALARKMNADRDMTKQMLSGLDKFSDVITKETKIVLMAKYFETLTGQNMTLALPPAAGKLYSATEVGGICGGISAAKIGTTANQHSLKAPEGQSNEYGTWIRSKSQHSSKEVVMWVYTEKAVEWFKAYFRIEKTA
jgi:prophage antirepressor-like protein